MNKLSAIVVLVNHKLKKFRVLHEYDNDRVSFDPEIYDEIKRFQGDFAHDNMFSYTTYLRYSKGYKHFVSFGNY